MPRQEAKSRFEQATINCFEPKVRRIHSISTSEIKKRAKLIEKTLKEFGIGARVVSHEKGSSVTLYELRLTPGTRIRKVVALEEEISMKLDVPPVRVMGPIPGKGTIGVEVPNPSPDTVRMREFLEKDYERLRQIPLPLLLEKTISGEPIIRASRKCRTCSLREQRAPASLHV